MISLRVIGCMTAMLIFSAASLLYGADNSRQGPREMDFGGHIWRIKSPAFPVAPGPNNWAHDADAVWLDEEGMHLTLSLRDGKWYASEVFTRWPLGYGTYTVTVDSDIASFSPDAVAGIFTWDTRPEEANREIDIEFSAWGKPGTVTAQYAVQPSSSSDRIFSFDPQLQGSCTTHRMRWTPDQLSFASYHGHIDPDSSEGGDYKITEWTFPGTPPTEGRAHIRINLWLFRGRTDRAEETELIIRSFQYEPWSR